MWINFIFLLVFLTASKSVWVPLTLSSVYWRDSKKELSTWDCAAKCIIVSIFSDLSKYTIRL